MVFRLVILSGMSVSCKHLSISIPSLPWMEVNFSNQNTGMPSWSDVFQSFLSVSYNPSSEEENK